MIRKFLCLIGFHKYTSDRNNLYLLRNEGNRSICRIDHKCIYCGKESSYITSFPKL